METTFAQLTRGTEIYYTGDMANCDGFGVVTRQVTSRWGEHVDIKMTDNADDRTMKGISPSNFDGTGRRFMLRAEYDALRSAKIREGFAAGG